MIHVWKSHDWYLSASCLPLEFWQDGIAELESWPSAILGKGSYMTKQCHTDSNIQSSYLIAHRCGSTYRRQNTFVKSLSNFVSLAHTNYVYHRYEYISTSDGSSHWLERKDCRRSQVSKLNTWSSSYVWRKFDWKCPPEEIKYGTAQIAAKKAPIAPVDHSTRKT